MISFYLSPVFTPGEYKQIIIRFLLFAMFTLALFSCKKDPASLDHNPTFKWKTSSPEEQGMDSESLDSAFTAA